MFLSTRYALTLFPGKTFYPSSMGVHPSTEKRCSSPVPCGSGRCSLGLCHSRNIPLAVFSRRPACRFQLFPLNRIRATRHVSY